MEGFTDWTCRLGDFKKTATDKPYWEMVVNDEDTSCRFENQERNQDTHKARLA